MNNKNSKKENQANLTNDSKKYRISGLDSSCSSEESSSSCGLSDSCSSPDAEEYISESRAGSKAKDSCSEDSQDLSD